MPRIPVLLARLAPVLLARLAPVLLAALALAAAPAASASAAAPERERGTALPDPDAPGLSLVQRFEALAKRVQFEQKNVTTLEAEFVQEKASEFLATPESSRGTISFASPDKVRWEYRVPKPISLVIHGETMLTWYRDLARAERVKVGRLSSQVLQYMNATHSLDSLLHYFRATASFPPAPQPYRLELVPRFARVARRLASMTLWIDRELYLPVRVRYVEPNGDVTEYRLDELRINRPIPAERFELELPAGVEVREIDLDRGRGRSDANAPPPGG